MPPWKGSAEQRQAREARRERTQRQAAARAARWAAADFSAPGADAPGIRRLAELNAEEPGADLAKLAARLDTEGYTTPAGESWTFATAAEYIRLLWPESGYAAWDRGAYGTYPGYTGPLRDTPQFERVGGRDDKVGRPIEQLSCQRCHAEWPSGWPGTESEESEWGVCPDCGAPAIRWGVSARTHSVIDLHWMLHTRAPVDPGPCPVCGAPRALFACGHPTSVSRILTWHCTNPEASMLGRPAGRPYGEPDPRAEHHAAASTPVRWRAPADADVYWLALDLLRVAAAAGEVTTLPQGAVHSSLDGDGAKWVYDGSRFRPVDLPD